MTFTNRLDELKQKHGLNNSTLAKQTGIPYTTIDGWYKRGCDRISLDTLRILSEFFECSVDFLMGTDNTDNFTFAGRLKQLRTERKLTQTELASRLNVSSGTIAMWETHKRMPAASTLSEIADYFGCSVDYLLGKKDGCDTQLPNRLKHLREQNSMTQAEFAEKLNVSQNTVSNWENGNRTPDIDVLVRIAGVFDCSLDYLTGRSDCCLLAPPNDTAITDKEMLLVEKYRRLNDHDKTLVEMMLDRFVK